jgi:hypothetical protein
MSLGIQRQNTNPPGSQDAAGSHVGPTVRLSVTHGLKQYDVAVPPQITIGKCLMYFFLVLLVLSFYILGFFFFFFCGEMQMFRVLRPCTKAFVEMLLDSELRCTYKVKSFAWLCNRNNDQTTCVCSKLIRSCLELFGN